DRHEPQRRGQTRCEGPPAGRQEAQRVVEIVQTDVAGEIQEEVRNNAGDTSESNPQDEPLRRRDALFEGLCLFWLALRASHKWRRVFHAAWPHGRLEASLPDNSR